MISRRLEHTFFLVILGIILLVMAWLLRPYFTVIVLIISLALVFQPLYRFLLNLFRHKNLAAFITVLLVFLIVFVPVSLVSIRISNEIPSLYAWMTQSGGYDFGLTITTYLQDHFKNFEIPTLSLNVGKIAEQSLVWLLANVGLVFSSIGWALFTALLSLIGLFYILRDGSALKRWVLRLLPIAPTHEEEIVREMRSVVTGVVRGTLLTAVIQGIIVGIGFVITGIPNPAFWGILVVVFSPIPIIGTWLVVVPAIAYLLFSGEIVPAISLAVWCGILVNLIYNIVTPELMQRGNQIHPFIILLSILGGLSAFGPIGFLAGPLIASLFFALFVIYPHLISQDDR